MDWMVPLRRLDESQQDVLRQCGSSDKKTKWIEGFAGSGKTVLLVHAIQNHLQQNPHHKVCVVVFTHALIELIRTGIAPEFRNRIPVITYHKFERNKHVYDLVVLDEVQDIPENTLKIIQSKAKRLIVGGDDAQSIYEDGCSAEEIEVILEPHRLKLPVVYRLTRKIINVVKTILPDNHLVMATSGRMEEIQVSLAHADSRGEELKWVWQQAERFAEIGHPSVVVLSNRDNIQEFIRFVANTTKLPQPEFPLDRWGKPDYSHANLMLKNKSTGAYLQYLGNQHGSLKDSDLASVVYVMTYHSIKGLDFRTVFLPLLTSELRFSWGNPNTDRRLFFVGATRSRRDLFLSYHGDTPHRYVQALPQQELNRIKIYDDAGEAEDGNFVF